MPYSDLQKIAFVGDYLPRKCGIATFTHDLRNAVDQFAMAECIVVPVDDIEGGYEYATSFGTISLHRLLSAMEPA